MTGLPERVRRVARSAGRFGAFRALRNLGWLAGGQLAGDAVAFVFFVLLSRRFGPEGVGVYALAVAVASVGRTVVSLGVDDFGVRELAARTRDDEADFVGRILGAQCWLAVLYLVGCGLFLALAGLNAQSVTAVGLLVLYHLSGGISRGLFLPAFARQRMAGPAFLDAGSRILAMTAGMALMLLGEPTLVETFVGFPVLGLLMLGGATWLALRELGGLRIAAGYRCVLGTARKAWPFAAGDVVFQLHARADVVMLSLLAGSAATGIYAAGLKFVEVVLMVVALSGFALYPRLSRLAEQDRPAFDLAVSTVINGGFLACVLLGWAVFVFVPDLLPLFFGADFADTATVVKLFAFLLPVMGIRILGARLMLAAGGQVEKLRFDSIATGLNIALNGMLIPLLAVEGAILASLASVSVNVGLALYYLREEASRALLRPMIRGLGPIFGTSLGVAAVVTVVGAAEIWAAVAFLVSFTGATLLSGWGSSLWSDALLLAGSEQGASSPGRDGSTAALP